MQHIVGLSVLYLSELICDVEVIIFKIMQKGLVDHSLAF